jgi:hypothetical protein
MARRTIISGTLALLLSIVNAKDDGLVRITTGLLAPSSFDYRADKCVYLVL